MITTKQYDSLNRLTNIVSSTNSAAVAQWMYQYNQANQRTRADMLGAAFGNSAYWVYQYDNLGQVTSAQKYWSDDTPVAGQQFGYGFDTIGNRTQTQVGGGQFGELRTAAYTANNLNQYTSRTVPPAVDIMGSANPSATVTINNKPLYRRSDYYWLQYGVNNSASAVWSPVTNLAVLNNGSNPDIVSTNIGNVFLPQTPESFSYDSDGNLTSDGRWNYVWDAENRLIQMIANSITSGPQSLKFAYDFQGRRVSKRVWSNRGSTGTPDVTLKFLYDGWNPVSALNASGSVVATYTWGLDLSGSQQGAGGVGGLVIVGVSGSGTNFVAYDGNGNVSALVNTLNGTITAQYEYGPFGEVIRMTGAMAKANPFRFSTKYQDDETDLLYYGYRYYNPATGRWPSRDPLGERGGINLYGALINDLINSSDSLGLCKCVVNSISLDSIGSHHYSDGDFGWLVIGDVSSLSKY
jgi:RHS repeat-associated protein